MNDAIAVDYHGVEITYNERRNRWVYTVRGRESSSESLALAREAIDKPAPSPKPNFNKRKAWLLKYGRLPEEVTVTSIAEEGYGSGTYFWIMNGKQRSKESGSELYEKHNDNDAKVKEISLATDEISAIIERRDKIRSSMERFKEQP